MKTSHEILVGIVDDQQLFVRSLSALVKTFPGYAISVNATNGRELIDKLDKIDRLPDILILDVNMPVMDGVETAKLVSSKYPLIRIVALSVKDDDITVIKMLKAGCCSYLLKDINPEEFEKALAEIYGKGYYNGDLANINYRRLIVASQQEDKKRLTSRELEFLQLACSDLTYKQIAQKMHLSERTIDGYRESLFEKLNVQSRVGMAMEAIRRKLVSV